MEVVGAFACSHAGLIYERRDQAPPGQLSAVLAGYERMRQAIEDLAPDALVIVGTDHGKIYPLTHSPQYVVGVSQCARGIGDATLPVCEVPLHQQFAQALLQGGLQRGVDLSFSEDMAIDHSFVTVLMLANPEARFPIVPVVQNCNIAPRPALKRSYKVGKKLGKALRGGPQGRVVVVGTGGMSHWVGSAERIAFNSGPPGSRLPRMSECPPLELAPTGPINLEFDHLFLDVMKQGQASSFAHEWSEDRLQETAGNGAHELRNWLTVAAMVGDAPAEVLAYEPVAEWLTGFGVIQFKLQERS
jgi:2,3-dihydroxyphenylpropionate 1,2-dioxygenase